MKKILLMAAALLTFASCAEKEVNSPEEQDSIVITPDTKKPVSGKGGKVKVIVESNTDWVLEGEHALVTPSDLSGSDGAVVEFDVKANPGEETTAEYTFIAGKATAPLTIKILKADVDPDDLALSAADKEFDVNGGEYTITVISSKDWTVAPKEEGGYPWAHIKENLTGGKNEAEVTFIADKNTEGVERTAAFVFSCGNAEPVEFTIKQLAGIKPVITVTSDNPVEIGYAAGTFDVLLSLAENMNYRDLECEIAQEGEWLTKSIPLAGDAEHTAKITFTSTQHDGLEAREATVTFKYTGAEDVTVNVKQLPQSVLKVDLPSQKLEVAGGDVSITVTANVEYDVTLSDGADAWLLNHTQQENVHKWAYSAWNEGGKREATVTFTEKNPATGMDPLTATVKLTQSNFLITTAAYMKGRCAGVETWKKPELFKLGKTFTIEMLVKHDKDFEYTSSWNGNGIGTLFGTERRLLVRHGDNQSNYQKWELVYAKNEKESNGDHKEVKVFSSVDIPAAEWAHIAVVFDEAAKKVTLYQDGVSVGSGDMDSDMRDIDLTETYQGNEGLQKFYLGRSYSNNRDFCGLMSEVRIWKKALTADDINAANHFYSVPADSEGLIAYWKMDDGTGYRIKDYTVNGNDLTGEEVSGSTWSAGMKWQEVELP